jgi:hypothetical protein
MLGEILAVGGAYLSLLLGIALGARQEAQVRRELAAERARTTDLLSRLAARTHAEYAAFEPGLQPAVPAEVPTIWDDTGLIEAEIPQDREPPSDVG